MIDYKIISTGSQGNAVVINGAILIDCGVPFKALVQFYSALNLVLLTHIHSDHFCRAAIRALSNNRPALRFACGRWLVDAVVQCGVSKQNIDVLDFNNEYDYGICSVIPVPLKHNVPNQGYKIHFPADERMIYATDTNDLNGITAPNYDLYMIEANYEDDEIRERIRQKKAVGEYAYESQVIQNHLSKAKADDFIYSNAGANSEYVYMHCHCERGTA